MTIIAAADIGYGSVKAMIKGKDAIHFPSGAAPADKVPTRFDGSREKPLQVGGVDWYAGFEPDISSHRRHVAGRFALSPDYHALFLETLARLGARQIDVMALGLPSREFETEVKDYLKKTFAGEHQIRGKSYTVGKILVADQPLGTAVLHYDKNAKRLERGRLLVVDIGYGTTDVAVIVRGGVDRQLSMSLDSAMGTVCHALERALSTPSRTVKAEQVDEHLRAGEAKMVVRGEQIDIGKAMAPHADHVSREIVHGILGGIGSFADVSEMLVTGGGATVLGDPIAKMTNGLPVTVMDQPVTANLRGFVAMAASHG